MRISDIFTSETVLKPKKLTRRFVLMGLLLTGTMSLLIVFVTFYGLNTGQNVLRVTPELIDKGIEVSTSVDFIDPKTELIIEPISEIGDMIESNLNMEAAIATDGQYFDPRVPYYIAYTFYIRNSGTEMINMNYKFRIIDSTKGIENALIIKYREHDLETDLITINNYQKSNDRNIFMDENILNFNPGAIKKITFFIWFDGNLSDASMLGGTLKMELLYSITNAEDIR